MNKAFEKILGFIDEQIKIEESVAKSENEGHPITHQYGANCMSVIKKFVQKVAEEYNYLSEGFDSGLLRRIADYFSSKYEGNDKTAPKMELSVDDLRYIASLNVEKCRLQTELHEEYNKGWIPCSKRLPSKEELIKSYIRKMYGAEFIVMIEGANKPTTLYYTLDGMWKDDYGEFYKVIAWQLLPESYKGSSQQDTV